MTEVHESNREHRRCGDGTSENAGRMGPAKEQSSMLTVLLVFGAPVAILAATVGEIEMVPAKDPGRPQRDPPRTRSPSPGAAPRGLV